MTTSQENDDVAAVLVVAVESGLLTPTDALRVIDSEILARSSPEGWLVDASMAKEPQDLMHSLRQGAGSHPILEDVWALLEVMDRALARGASAMDLAPRLWHIYPYGEWPAELDQALYDVYEEATCAHDHGGVPQPKYVERTLRVLLAAGKGRSAWSPVLERVLQGA